jgi:hypothetical protein
MTTVFNALETQQFVRGDGIKHRIPVVVASTVNVDLSTDLEDFDIDGYSVQLGDRILLKNQTVASQNGIYTIESGAGASYRAEDLIAGDDASHITVQVQNGTANQKTEWACTSVAAEVDTDDLTWTMKSKFNYAQNDLFYASSSSELSTLSSTANRVLVTGPGGAISWSDTLPDATKVVALPSGDTDIANKAYVDQVAAGLDVKESVRCRTIGPLSNNDNSTPANYNPTGGSAGTGAFNGVKLDDPTRVDPTTGWGGDGLGPGQRILIMNQEDPKQNGIYVVTGGQSNNANLERASDQNGSPAAEVSGGNFTFCERGTKWASTGWVLQGEGVLTLNTDELNWVQFSAATQFQGMDGITISGVEISADLYADGGVIFNGATPNGKLQVDLGATAITGTVATAHGGTGLTTYSVGDLLLGTAGSLTTLGSSLRKVLTTDNTGAGVVNWRNDVHLENIRGNDTNEPILLAFSNDNSAVNYLDLANSATTVAPRLSALGTDADVSLQLRSKGTGAIEILGDTDAGTLRLYNAADTFYAGLKAGAMASNITWTWPTTDGSADDILRTNGSGVLSFVNPDSVMRQVIPLMTVQAIANTIALTPVAYFDWDHAEYGSVLSAKLMYSADVTGGKTLEVEVWNETTSTQLAVDSQSASGFYKFAVTLPTANARLSIRLRKTTGGGANPAVFGASLVFNPAS